MFVWWGQSTLNRRNALTWKSFGLGELLSFHPLKNFTPGGGPT